MPPSDSAGPAEFSIPFPLDEKPTFYDEEAEITKLKDGRTALAFKAENAVLRHENMRPRITIISRVGSWARLGFTLRS
jgi:hypothetical protein